MGFSQYTNKKSEEVLTILESTEAGLSLDEAVRRQKIYGPNEMESSGHGLLAILFRQFQSPFFYLLFLAGAVSFFIGSKTDSAIIFLFVFINAALGFFQEARAEHTVALLKKYIPSGARVLRGGEKKTIDKSELVPGDIVLLEAGNIAPADLRILKSENLVVDESALSGESVSVFKNSEAMAKESKEIFAAKNTVFSGTAVLAGEAEAVAVAIGRETVLGDIAKLTSEIKKESVYEKSLLEFCRLVLRIVISTIVIVFLLNLILRGTANIFDFALFSIALIVSIVPEALPTVVTFALSQGSLKLARQKVVVRRLSAIEDLGDMEVLCTDKTGTITENKLELKKIYSRDKDKCLLYGLLGSAYARAEVESAANSFDSAMYRKASEEIKKELAGYRGLQEIPFDSFRMRNSALVEDAEGNRILITRGAPDVLLKLCSSPFGSLKIEDIKNELAKDGREAKRTLAVAFKRIDGLSCSANDEKNLMFLGYFSFSDPLKTTSKETIATAKKLGVRIKIITGDSPEVAGVVAKEVGLIEDPGEVMLGEKLDTLPAAELEKACADFSVFARVSPKTKFKIIEALEKKFEVGFLGEGINDTPALKAANVAIAVKGASDVSREASDIILLEKDLKVIVNGIKDGRNIFSNINKYIRCTLASNFGNFYSISLISLIIPYLPMLPIQILIVNLLSDFPSISVATDSVDVEELQKPKQYQLRESVWLIVLLALTSTVFDFIFFSIFRHSGETTLQTLWFIESILTELVLIYSFRSRRFFLKAVRPSFYMMGLSILTLFITVMLPFTVFGREIIHFTTPSVYALSIIFIIVISYFIVSEAVKLAYFEYKRKKVANGTAKNQGWERIRREAKRLLVW